jgi:hypothetical protein
MKSQYPFIASSSDAHPLVWSDLDGKRVRLAAIWLSWVTIPENNRMDPGRDPRQHYVWLH